MKKLLLFSLLSFIIILTACGNTAADSDSTGESSAAEDYGFTEGEKPVVQIEMENGGIIKLELYPDIAPITCANFLKLVDEGFYDGLIFHRVIQNFMIQGGDPEGTGYGGSDETIKGEFASNGVKNSLSHTRGVISMGRKGNDNDSASSQFFICDTDDAFLDGNYAAFGKVIEGMDVVDEIAAVKTDSNDKPYEDQVMKSITRVK